VLDEVLADEDADEDADGGGEAGGEWVFRATTGMALLCVAMTCIKLP